MFIKPSRIFRKKDENTEILIPKVMLEALNKNAPDGFEYKVVENGVCALVPVDDKSRVEISGLVVADPEKYIRILGEGCSLRDIENYAYNAQEPIEYTGGKDGKFILNGELRSINELFICPEEGTNRVNAGILLFPKKFPGPFEIKISAKGIENSIKMRRVPSKEPWIEKYEPIEDKCFTVYMSVNEKSGTIGLQYHFSGKSARSAQEMVESIVLARSWEEGKVFFFESVLKPGKSIDEDKKKQFDESERFWRKVIAIENELKLKFNIYEKGVDRQTSYHIEELYHMLIRKLPICEMSKLENVMAETEKYDVTAKIKVDATINAIINCDYEKNIFGQAIKLPSIVVFPNVRIESVKEKEDGWVETVLVSDTKDLQERVYCYTPEKGKGEYEEIDDACLEKFFDAPEAKDLLNSRLIDESERCAACQG